MPYIVFLYWLMPTRIPLGNYILVLVKMKYSALYSSQK